MLKNIKFLIAFFLIIIIFIDQIDPRYFRACESKEIIDTVEDAKLYALRYWREHPRVMMFNGKRYDTPEKMISGLETEAVWYIDNSWHFIYGLYLERTWYVGAEIGQFRPEHYGIGLDFNRCGNIIKRYKVGNG